MHKKPSSSTESDWLFNEEKGHWKQQMLNRVLPVARQRRRRRRIGVGLVAGLCLCIMGATLFLSLQSLEHASPLVQQKLPSVSPVEMPVVHPSKTSPSSGIRMLSDAQFEEMMKGYPMAIFQQGGRKHYVPLNP